VGARDIFEFGHAGFGKKNLWYEDNHMKDCEAIIKRLKKRQQEDEKKLRILFEITRMVSSFPHVSNFLDAIVRFLAREYTFDACAILLCDTDGNLKLMSKTGINDEFVERAVNSPIVRQCMHDCLVKREIIVKNDFVSEERTPSMKTEQLESFAVSPIMAEEETMGVLITASRKKGYFHERYFATFFIVVNQVGMAIKIAQLYDKIFYFSQNLEKIVNEKALQLAEAHKKLMRAERHAIIGKMADRVAHDLRNSLTVIGGFAHRLEKKIPETDPNYRYVKIILDETSRLEQKVARIIDMKNSREGA